MKDEIEKKSNEALVGLVIIIIILVIGGVYLWQSRIKQLEMIKAQNAIIAAQNEAIMKENANALDALEQDIKNTNTNIGVDTNSIK